MDLNLAEKLMGKVLIGFLRKEPDLGVAVRDDETGTMYCVYLANNNSLKIERSASLTEEADLKYCKVTK